MPFIQVKVIENVVTPEQVLRMEATGQANQQIVDALVLSSHAVHRHGASILTKLDQPSRAGAASYAGGQRHAVASGTMEP